MGTLYCLACLSGSRLKSKDWFQPTWGTVFASPPPRTETSQCGAEVQCWLTCPPSALRGSVRKNMRSTGRRLSSGSASETDYYKVCTLDSCVMDHLILFHQVQYTYSSNTVPWIGPFLNVCLSFMYWWAFLWSMFVISLDLVSTWHQWVSIDLLLALCLIYWDPPTWQGWNWYWRQNSSVDVIVTQEAFNCVLSFPFWECVSMSWEFNHKYISVCGQGTKIEAGL